MGSEDGGLGALRDRRGELARDWILGELFVPDRAWIDGDDLVWEADLRPDPDHTSHHRPSLPTVPVPRRMLDNFVNLAAEGRGGDGALVRGLRRDRVGHFAKKYGVFALSPFAIGEGMPHPLASAGDREAEESVALFRQGAGDDPDILAVLDDPKRAIWRERDYPKTITGREPLSRWEGLARQARATLRIAATLHGSLWARSSREDWHDALCLGTGRLPSDAPLLDALAAPSLLDRRSAAIPNDWSRVITIVNSWLHESGVRPVFTWDAPGNKPPNLALTGGDRTLLGPLAVQLAAAISRATDRAFCSACGDLYEPGKRPRVGLPHYCDNPGCRRKMSAINKREYDKRHTVAAEADPCT